MVGAHGLVAARTLAALPGRQQIRELRHHPQRGFTARHPLHIVERVAEAGDVVIPRRPGEMCGQDHIVDLEQRIVGARRFGIENVEAGAE